MAGGLTQSCISCDCDDVNGGRHLEIKISIRVPLMNYRDDFTKNKNKK